jgi:uncharacterized protein YndB with AHSA1/START domain
MKCRTPAVYLGVVKNERLVFTIAYAKAWEPAAKCMRKWAFTKAGASAPTSSRRWLRGSEAQEIDD